MFVFLSYASAQKDAAEQVSLALAGSGHKVFFDRDTLPPGDDYHARIRGAVEESDAFVFLVSPKSVDQGSYALTELKYARQRWPNPKRRVLPVMLEKTPFERIPNYLKAVTILEPEGNVPAEVVHEIDGWQLHGAEIHDPAPIRNRPQPSRPQFGTVPSTRSSDGLGRRVAAGVLGAFGAIMVFLSVVDAAVGGLSEGGLLIGAVALGVSYGLWPRRKDT